MHIVDAEPTPATEPIKRTIHVWMVEEPEQPGRLWRAEITHWCIRILALAMMAGFVFFPGEPLSHIITIVVPAILLPPQTIQASAAIVPTGVQTIQATRAQGLLTIYNGSILQETLPAGFIVTSQSGIEVTTDQAVTIAAANLPAPGVATVSARAVIAGKQGNIAAGSINQADGTSLVIKNLDAFSGGRDASARRYVTSADRDNALAAARQQVENEQLTASHPGKLLAGCTESAQVEASAATVRWSCQYATFAAPQGAQVLSARLQGRRVALRVNELLLPS